MTPETTDEGLPISKSLLAKGYMADEEMLHYPGVIRRPSVHPVVECSQNIPCDPCQDACAFGCIKIGDRITDLPTVVEGSECRNCGACVAACPGQAIFLVTEDAGDGFGSVSFPYEFLPVPEIGTRGKALGRNGRELCDAEIIDVKNSTAFDRTTVLTMKVPKEFAMNARFFKAEV